MLYEVITRIVTTISTDNEKDFLYISIKDNGKGMSKEFLENVIDPFTTSRTTRKVGLGIPLFKDVITSYSIHYTKLYELI